MDTLFPLSEEVICPGVKHYTKEYKGAYYVVREPHPTTVDNFYINKNGKRRKECIDCNRAYSKEYKERNRAGYKKAKYRFNPITGEREKWCYKRGENGGHWEDPANFCYNSQWDDRRHCYCDTCEKAYWANRDKKFNRLNAEYSAWQKAVFQRDGEACVLCGKTGNLHAHHKDGYHWCEERQYDVSNGVTLCPTHHNDFHEVYGKGNNTEAQWEEYEKWYRDLTTPQ